MENKPVGAGVPDGPRKSLPLEDRAVRGTASFSSQLRSFAAEMGSSAQVAAPQALTDEVASQQANASNRPAANPNVPSSASLRSAPSLRGEGKGKPEKGRGWVTRVFYPVIYCLLFVGLRLYHFPRFRGRENLPEGPCVICGNHSGFADPLWVSQLLGPKLLPWTMARKSLFEKSAFARNFLLTFRAFPVDRDNADMAAIKKSLSVLKNGEKLLIFPEGTRVKNGKKSEPKSGAVLLAQRAGVPLVPVYVTHGRKPFQPVKVVMGEAYTPKFASRRPSNEELEEATAELMEKVYALGK